MRSDLDGLFCLQLSQSQSHSSAHFFPHSLSYPSFITHAMVISSSRTPSPQDLPYSRFISLPVIGPCKKQPMPHEEATRGSGLIRFRTWLFGPVYDQAPRMDPLTSCLCHPATMDPTLQFNRHIRQPDSKEAPTLSRRQLAR